MAVIEVLSFGNKKRGHEAQELYLQKQEEILRSQTHLLEIDLLRSGEHTIAAPRRRLSEGEPWHYLACLHRAGRSDFEVWGIHLRRRLPRLPVPLLDNDPDAVLDLQACFDACYNEKCYDRRLNYSRAIEPPLDADDAQWADALLREKGLR